MKKEIIEQLIPYFEKNEKYFFLCGDSGFGAIDKLQEKFPGRVLNCGIMEQGMVGIAAGMAMSGMIPIVYTISNFLVYRALEQIRNDVVLQNLNVKFIGIGANDYFSFLGKSHTCGDDDISILKIIGLQVYRLFEDVMCKWVTEDVAGYLRI